MPIDKYKLHKQFWDRHDSLYAKILEIDRILSLYCPIEDMYAIEKMDKALTKALEAGQYLSGAAYDGECS